MKFVSSNRFQYASIISLIVCLTATLVLYYMVEGMGRDSGAMNVMLKISIVLTLLSFFALEAAAIVAESPLTKYLDRKLMEEIRKRNSKKE